MATRLHAVPACALSWGLIGLLLLQQVPVPVHLGGPCRLENCDCEEGICQCDHWIQRDAARRAQQADGPVVYPCPDAGSHGPAVLTLDRTLIPEGIPVSIPSSASVEAVRVPSFQTWELAFRLLRPPRA